mmetsp:Transcript_1689/g.2890  ORF Transcript_1689/g.2890 Transcript_1689/m.2890 type:complete len:193 (+) Transcript_1689:298-876(+)
MCLCTRNMALDAQIYKSYSTACLERMPPVYKETHSKQTLPSHLHHRHNPLRNPALISTIQFIPLHHQTLHPSLPLLDDPLHHTIPELQAKPMISNNHGHPNLPAPVSPHTKHMPLSSHPHRSNSSTSNKVLEFPPLVSVNNPSSLGNRKQQKYHSSMAKHIAAMCFNPCWIVNIRSSSTSSLYTDSHPRLKS